MKTKGNQRRDSVARSLRRNMDSAARAAAHYPNYYIQIEMACRQGVSRQIATTYYGRKYKKALAAAATTDKGKKKITAS